MLMARATKLADDERALQQYVVSVKELAAVVGLERGSSVVEIKEAQAVRAKDNENFQAATARSFSDLDTEVAGVRVELSKVTSELGKITGILTEMQRQDVARVMRYDEGRRVP